MEIGTVIDVREKLYVEQCYACQCFFAMPADLRRRRKGDGGSFWCPNGHQQHYTKSDIQILKKKLEYAEEQKQSMEERNLKLHDKITSLGYSLRAQKAAKTKILNRVKKGVCPCCNRTFQNLQSHFKNKHPELLNDN